MNDKEIIDNAPEGATHIDEDGCYVKQIDYVDGLAPSKIYFNWGEGWKMANTPIFHLLRSLADIKRIVELEEALQCKQAEIKILQGILNEY